MRPCPPGCLHESSPSTLALCISCPCPWLSLLLLMLLMLLRSLQSKIGDPEIDDRAYELKELMEGERFTPLFKVRMLVGRLPRPSRSTHGSCPVDRWNLLLIAKLSPPVSFFSARDPDSSGVTPPAGHATRALIFRFVCRIVSMEVLGDVVDT